MLYFVICISKSIWFSLIFLYFYSTKYIYLLLKIYFILRTFIALKKVIFILFINTAINLEINPKSLLCPINSKNIKYFIILLINCIFIAIHCLLNIFIINIGFKFENCFYRLMPLGNQHFIRMEIIMLNTSIFFITFSYFGILMKVIFILLLYNYV